MLSDSDRSTPIINPLVDSSISEAKLGFIDAAIRWTKQASKTRLSFLGLVFLIPHVILSGRLVVKLP